MNLPQHLDKCRRLVTIPAGDVQGDLAVVAAWQVSRSLHALETNVDFGSVVFGRLSARRIFSGPGHSAGSVLFFCDCRHLSVTRP
jgi:hypothetical protein